MYVAVAALFKTMKHTSAREAEDLLALLRCTGMHNGAEARSFVVLVHCWTLSATVAQIVSTIAAAIHPDSCRDSGRMLMG